MDLGKLALRAALGTHAAMLRTLPAVLLFAVAGCVVPPSASQRLADSAYDLNTAARVGRMDIALEHVRDVAKEDFSRTRAAWGKSVRVMDYELSGVSLRKDGDADVAITVDWQRIDEANMRSTEIAQRWTNKRGTWFLIGEKERGGDKGLLGALTPAAPGPAAQQGPPPVPRSRFQTRVIYEQ